MLSQTMKYVLLLPIKYFKSFLEASTVSTPVLVPFKTIMKSKTKPKD